MIVNPYQNKDLSPVFLERQYRDACEALSTEAPSKNGIRFKVSFNTPAILFFYPTVFTSMCYFQVDYVLHVKDAETMMQRVINDQRFDFT